MDYMLDLSGQIEFNKTNIYIYIYIYIKTQYEN